MQSLNCLPVERNDSTPKNETERLMGASCGHPWGQGRFAVPVSSKSPRTADKAKAIWERNDKELRCACATCADNQTSYVPVGGDGLGKLNSV